jgi:cold shock CspA family protein|eukprot:TRINITY_DN6220_c0_g1_i1.p2 TRINITY_DN6220_c0_g1~~TRINITY_DN6220_c0_g1_i1.p2  ORF type:complete len:145 (+),score=12.58 TRINITY_DN6220_c0_g1_i1:1132-1566(+)
MAETFNKKEREKKKALRKKEKRFKKEIRKDQPVNTGWESMMAYVDENGLLRDTPPDSKNRREIQAKSIEIGVPKREKEEIDPVLHGVINYFDDAKGYGFIKTADDESFFVHQNHISGQPAKGKRVRFEKERGAKGWAAVKVVLE